jgi:hypothetical protein
VPTEVCDDGTVVSHFGPGMDAVATRTAWEPPHRFAAEGEGFGPNESLESGWPWFFGILRLHLSHFSGRPCSIFRAMGVARGPVSSAWNSLIGHLDLALATVGQHRIAGADLYLYGDQAAAVVASDQPLWQACMNEHFPMEPAPGQSC